MFERLQQPITIKLPRRRRRGRGKAADQLEQASALEGVADQTHELDGVSGAEGVSVAPLLGDASAPADAFERYLGASEEHDPGLPAHGEPIVPELHGESSAAQETPEPTSSVAQRAGEPEWHDRPDATAPGPAFAAEPPSYAPPSESSSAFGADLSAPHTDAPHFEAPQLAAPALHDEALGAGAVTGAHLRPVASFDPDGLGIEADSAAAEALAAAGEASVAGVPAEQEVPAAPARVSRISSLRARRLSTPHRGSARRLVGLDIEPGQVVAVQAHVNGEVVVDRAAGVPLAPDVIRDGEVNDPDALREALRALFAQSKLDRRVRIGIANQRIVMRRIELPPITDAKEIASAVRFQAADEIPMPLESVVLDYHSLGIVETPAGPRLHVVLVAARRDMVQRVLDSARAAGLRPEGVDLAAFAMIRALRRGARESTEQVLYLSIGGITNLAIASGATCEFTRAIGTGIEQIIAEVASRCGIALGDARRLLAHVAALDAATSLVVVQPRQLGTVADSTTADHESTARIVLNDGVRRIAGEVRHSLDFHVSSGRGQGVARAVLCGPALDVPGFATILGAELGMPVSAGTVALASPDVAEHVPASRLAVAAGLAVEDGPA